MTHPPVRADTFGLTYLVSPQDLISHSQRSVTIERIQTRVNSQIRISPLRVIGPDGTQYGVITLDEALNRAREADLDLVEVAPNERPPVCRIMDFGKFKYEKNKKSGQKTHQTKTKEIRLRPKTGEHDVETKVRKLESPPSQQGKKMIAMLAPK
ncbi:MAG: translation initiation factor IF-3 [Planctomycetaceae bacterium]|nr:translation initiation factor IF-3 [Planctomycetaceae bacterium]